MTGASEVKTTSKGDGFWMSMAVLAGFGVFIAIGFIYAYLTV